MRRRARAGIVALALALTALSSCGASGTSTVERARPGGTRGRAEADRQLRGTGLRRRRPRLPEAPLRGRAGGQDRRSCATAAGSAAPSSTSPAWSPSEGERGLLSVAFPPDYRESGRFYVYYTDNSGDIRIDEFHRRSQTRAAAGSRRTVIAIPHPENSNHNGGQLAVPRQPPLLRHRRRRLRRRPAEQRPEPGEPARQAAADRPAAVRRAAVLGSRLATRSSAGPAATRSTATGSATPSASRSTR